MKMMRPHFFFSMPGRYWRERRTPLKTLTSKKCIQSASGISANALGSKMPRLLMRTSASGTCLMNALMPSRLPRSGATPRPPAHGGVRRDFADLFYRGGDPRFGAAVYDYVSELGRQSRGDCESDSRCG